MACWLVSTYKLVEEFQDARVSSGVDEMGFHTDAFFSASATGSSDNPSSRFALKQQVTDVGFSTTPPCNRKDMHLICV